MVETTAIASLLGLSVGSFINSCAYRLPRKIPLARVRSFCPTCGHGLTWIELVPLVSFVLQKGKCKACGSRISWRYSVIEASATTITFLIVQGSMFQVESLVACLFAWIMILVAAIDHAHLVIPNRIILFGLISILGLKAVFMSDRIIDALTASIVSTGLMLGIRAAGNLAFKKESMGMGDVKLAGLIGLQLGIVGFLAAVWFASIGGLLFALTWSLRGNHSPFTIHHSPSRIPFGSFLALSSILVILFQSQLSEFIDSWLIWTP